jgi:hypothetical protein
VSEFLTLNHCKTGRWELKGLKPILENNLERELGGKGIDGRPGNMRQREGW